MAVVIITWVGRDSGNISRTSVRLQYTPPITMVNMSMFTSTGLSTLKRGKDFISVRSVYLKEA